MLHDLIQTNRDTILSLARERLTRSLPHRGESELMYAMPEVLDELCSVVAQSEGTGADTTERHCAALLGAQRQRLGFEITDVVHDYAALCESITRLILTTGAQVSAKEYLVLSRAVDKGIAEAISEHSHLSTAELQKEAAERLGFLVHELRNALSSATLAFAVLKRGEVSLQGRTAELLERAHQQMADLISTAMSEVRLRSGGLKRDALPLRRLLEDIRDAATAVEEKHVTITLEVDAPAEASVEAERNLLTSALLNLLQNAVKFSHAECVIQLRARMADNRVVVEVEDRCGGLPPGKVQHLFRPFVQGGEDRRGLGLGLTIARQAVEAHGGKIHVRSLEGLGCIFTIELPRSAPPLLAAQ